MADPHTGQGGMRVAASPPLIAVLAALLLETPVAFLSSYHLGLLALVATFTIAALAQNLLTGYADVPSLGNVVFLAAAAYVTGTLLTQPSIPAGATFIIAIIASALLGLVVGLPALRISGMHLAIVTVALVFAAQELMAARDASLPDTVLSVHGPGWILHDRGLYALAVALAVLAYLLVWNLLHSRTGRALVALSENQTAASAAGIDPTRYRLLAFMLSGALSGLAGILYLYHFQHVSHATFTLDLSLAFLAMMFLGGTRSLGGSLLGGILIGGLTLSPQVLPATIAGIDVQQAVVGLYALLLLLTLRFFPAGIWNSIADRWTHGPTDKDTDARSPSLLRRG